MIYTSIKYLRISSLWIGFTAILISFFIPLYSSCKWNSDESGTIGFVVYGYEKGWSYVVFLFVLLVFFSGYFWHRLMNKILLYLFSIILLLIFFLTLNLPGWGGAPCIRHSEIGQHLIIFGSFSVILGTFISIYREVD